MQPSRYMDPVWIHGLFFSPLPNNSKQPNGSQTGGLFLGYLQIVHLKKLSPPRGSIWGYFMWGSLILSLSLLKSGSPMIGKVIQELNIQLLDPNISRVISLKGYFLDLNFSSQNNPWLFLQHGHGMACNYQLTCVGYFSVTNKSTSTRIPLQLSPQSIPRVIASTGDVCALSSILIGPRTHQDRQRGREDS